MVKCSSCAIVFCVIKVRIYVTLISFVLYIDVPYADYVTKKSHKNKIIIDAFF